VAERSGADEDATDSLVSDGADRIEQAPAGAASGEPTAVEN
jgi:hypothetical protein